MNDRVRETELQIQGVALGCGTKAHADQSELALEALGHAGHHIAGQSAKRSGHGLGFTGFIGSSERDVAVLDFDCNTGMYGLGQGSQGTFDRQDTICESRLGPLGEGDWNTSNTRHFDISC